MPSKRQLLEWSFILLLSILSWKLIDLFIVEISLWKYFIVEAVIILMMKLAEYGVNQLDKED